MSSNRRRIARATMIAAGAAAALVVGTPGYSAAVVSGTVSAGKAGLAVRAGASSDTPHGGMLANRTKIKIACYVVGQKVKGRVRTTDRWDRLVNGQYVSDAFVRRGRSVPACPPPPPAPLTPATPLTSAPKVPATPLIPADPDGPVAIPQIPILIPPVGAVAHGPWVAPVPGKGTSGFRTASRPTHDGIDIMAAKETPIRATADGTVIRVVCNTSGPTCDVDGSPTTSGCGWYAEILHAGDVITRYCHMIRRPDIEVGQTLQAGQIFGYVGTSGHSSGPHLHFEVHFGKPPATRANAIDPVPFMAAAGAPVA